MGDAMIRELLLSDDVAGQVELLLNLLSDAAAGRELSNVVSEVIQVTIAGGVGQQQVKQLAYDLCKAVPLLPSDYGLLVDGIKNDISCGVPEAQVLALRYLPHLPPEHLLHLLDKGDIANFVEPHTRSTSPPVRCAATSALAAVLLVPEVQAALAASPDLATSGSDWWDSVVDAVGDSMPDVLVSGLAATNALFEAAAAGGSAAGGAGSSTGCVVAAQRAALRLAAGMGPLLDTWRMLHTHAQVPVIQLLGHLWGHLLAADAAAAAHAAATAAGGRLSNSGGGAAADLPESSSGSIAAALPGILAYLTNSLNSLNPAVKLEAARVLLRVSKASSSSSSSSSGDGLLSRMRLVGAVPPATAAAAIEALLELKGRLLVEAALEEVVSLVAAHLELLQVPTRLAVLQRLWPMIALLQSPTDRLTAFAHSWRAALDLAISSGSSSGSSQGQPEGAAATLSAILSDPFLADVISERPAAAAAAAATGGSGGGAPPDSSDAAAAAAGPTGGSTVSSAAGGVGGVSAAEVMGIGGAAAGPTGGSDRERIVLSGSFSGSSSSRKLKLMKSAKGMLSSGAALASNMGGAIATAATTGLAAIPLPKWMEGPAPARAQLPATLKQELVCTLLEVLQQHPAADAALKLPLGKPVPQPAPGAAAAAAAAAAATASQGGQMQQQQDASAAADAAADVPVSPASTTDGNPAAAAAAAMAAAAAAATGATPASPSSATPAAATIPTPPPNPIRPQFGPEDVSVSPVVASLQAQVVTWLGAAVTALQHSRACLHWEPLVPPPMPGNPPAPPLPPLASVNLTTVPVDAWLTLLQAACQAVRGVLRLHGYDSLKAIYRANGGRMLPQLSPWDASGSLARTAESAAAALQQLLARELAEWRGLAHAVRPRVLWVAAHYLELPNLFDESWGLLLAWLEDALLRSVKAEGDARCRQLAASARDGLLLKKWAMPQLSNLGRDKSGAQTTFDAAAASALVEMPEYRSDGLQVGLTVLQYLAWVVQASCAASAAAAAAAAAVQSSTAANGAASAAAAGPAEAVLARKLLELVKAVGAQDAAGVDTREWCKRMVRMLSAAADPAAAAAAGSGVAATHAGGPAFAMAPPPPSSGPGAAKAALPSGYNAVAGFSALGFGGGDSSDDDDEGPAGLSREERLKQRLGLSKRGGGGGGSGRRKGGRNRGTADSSSDDDNDDAELSSSSSSSSDESSKSSGSSGSDAAAGGSSDSDAGGPALHNPLSGLQLGGQTNNADGQSNTLTGGGIAGKERRAQRRAAKAAKKVRKARAAAATFAVGAPDVASGVWGYPFGGPRSATLFISRRSRRHRLFKWQLAMALAYVAEEDSRAAGAAAGAGGLAAAGGGSSSRRNAQLGGLFGAGGSGGSGFSGLSGSAAGSVGTTMAVAGLTDATGPVFSAESGFRLDQAGFWDSLPGGASGWQELSGPNDPLVLAGRYSAAAGAGSAAGEISVVLRAFNRLPVDLEGVEVAVRLVGPARAERREASWMLPRLLPTEAAQHSFKLLPTGYGRLEVHARLLLPVPQLASEAASAPALACQPLSISMAHLLSPPACPPASAQDMLALWASLPVQVELSGTAVWPGLDGLLLLLSALARQPLHCAWAHMLPVVCGAQAAFVACPTTHTADALAIMVVAQLMPEPAAAAAADAAATAGADAAKEDGQQQQQQQQQLDAAGGLEGQQKQQKLRGAVQLVVRASSHEVLLAIQQQPEAWLTDISQGTLSLGVVAGAAPPRPSRGKTMLHPCIARLAQQLAAAAAVMPPPAAVPPLQLPPLPTFGKKLRAKADEEDSDAEDEELPPSEQEAAAQQAALEKHAADCNKACEAHAAAKASRAGTVLRRAALAEWRRAACPSMA